MAFKFCAHPGPDDTICNRIAGHKDGEHTYTEPITEEPASPLGEWVVIDRESGRLRLPDVFASSVSASAAAVGTDGWVITKAEYDEIIGADVLLLALKAEHPDVPAYVEQTGGGTATLYIGTKFGDDTESGGNYPVVAGPGSYNWSNGNHSTFSWEEFVVGPDDYGVQNPDFPKSIEEFVAAVTKWLAYDAERWQCPKCGEQIRRTLDGNSGTLRFRCEPCDHEECGHGCGQWVTHDDDRGWHHVAGSFACFLHAEEPIALGALKVGDRVIRPHHDDEVVTVAAITPRTPKAISYFTLAWEEGGDWTHHVDYLLHVPQPDANVERPFPFLPDDEPAGASTSGQRGAAAFSTAELDQLIRALDVRWECNPDVPEIGALLETLQSERAGRSE